MPRAGPSHRCQAARLLPFASLAALTLVLGAWSAGQPDTCVLSRHTGEVLAGDCVAEHGTEAERALSLARRARIDAEAGRGTTPPDGGIELLVEPDRVVAHRGGAGAVPPPTRADTAVEVQVFGLVGADQVQVRCPGQAVRVRSGEIEELTPGWRSLRTALGTGSIVCAEGPWQVRVAGSQPRPYSGIFSFRPLPERRPEPGSTARQARARRGSEVIFRTTLSAYVAGVLAAEDARLGGEAAIALAQVIAHDARVERHPGRPLCDTTHCQVFLGTAGPTPPVAQALSLPDLPTDRWLPFFRGGDEPWELRRDLGQVRAVLGDFQRFGGSGRLLEVVRTGGVEHVACEPVRSALKLPSCPTDGAIAGETVRIRGRGRGHGVGLDVEAARTSGLTAPELLRRAYGL